MIAKELVGIRAMEKRVDGKETYLLDMMKG